MALARGYAMLHHQLALVMFYFFCNSKFDHLLITKKKKTILDMYQH